MSKEVKEPKFNKALLIIALITVVVFISGTIAGVYLFGDKKEQTAEEIKHKEFIQKIEDKKKAEKEKALKDIDFNTIVGTWYYIPDNTVEMSYEFKKDGKAVLYTRDLDEPLEGQEDEESEIDLVYEGETEDDELATKGSEYKYTLKENKGKLVGEDENFDYKYIIDGEDTRLVLENEDFEEPLIFYKSVYKAREKCENYKTTIEYMKDYMDKDGWVIIDGELLAYLGTAKEVTVPKIVKVIKTSAFSWDFNRAKKVEKVTIPGNVKEIQAGAFAFTMADKIIIEEGVQIIGDDCFSDSYIDEIHFPKSVKKIGEGIMETEEGLTDCKIYCVKDSPMDKHMKENKPYGSVEIKYE